MLFSIYIYLMQVEQDFKHSFKDVDLFTKWLPTAKQVIEYAKVRGVTWRKDLNMEHVDLELLSEGT